MTQNNYFYKYHFNWEAFEVIINGKSSIDATTYLSYFSSHEDVKQFLDGYGFDTDNPVQKGELFGHYQESLQFIKRFFLKEGNSDGLDLQIPNSFYSLTDLLDLFVMATDRAGKTYSVEDSLWASVILKVMHTILHADKDLRYSYFSTIQQQILDNYYKYLDRNAKGHLFLSDEDSGEKIPLVSFETKSKKSRESIIIKLLHKKQSVAEELFDRIGVRFITTNKLDCLRVVKFLYRQNVVIANNIKPSRSRNSLIDIEMFKTVYRDCMQKAIDGTWDESTFLEEMTKLAETANINSEKSNQHSSSEYKAIHFTCRQLIKYKNPFSKKFFDLRKAAKESGESELAKKVLELDTSDLSQDIRFFYPYEVQITDESSHEENTKGEASHNEYKKSQLETASKRLFSELIDFYSVTK